jgi:sucrose PTS system EIIBCA or EIIBC component
MMVSPQLPNAWAVAGGDAEPLMINILGINFGIIGYQGSILPAILVGFLVSFFERKLRSVVPAMMDLIVTPFLSITLTLVIILFGLGVLMQGLERAVIGSIVAVLQAPFGIGYVIFAASQQLLVITGLHHSLGLIEINLISNTGFNVIQPLTTVSMAGQFGAAMASAWLIKNKVAKSNALSTTYSTLFGITEPLLFGLNMRSMRIFASGMIGGAVGGFVIYLLGLKANGMGITFLPGMLLYIGEPTIWPLVQYIFVTLISFTIGFLLVRMQSQHVSEVVNGS